MRRPRARLKAPAAAAIAAVLVFIAASVCAAVPRPQDIVHIAALTLDAPLAAGQRSTLVVAARIRAGWHINSSHPSDPDFIPTRLEVAPPNGVTPGAIHYPEAKEIRLAFSRGKLSVFTGAIAFTVPLTARAGYRATGLRTAISVTLRYQACNDVQCLRPVSVSRTMYTGAAMPLPAVGGGTASAAVPASASGSTNSGIEGVFHKYGDLIGFLLVLLGGLALNLTPCVYPLIGVTIAYFGNQGGGTRRVLTLAILYVAGIALTFSSVGVAVALSGGLFGAALENRYVLVAIAVMLLVLASSSFGLFSLQPPQWLMRSAGSARPGYLGSVVMGVGMGVVAAPCIGPIVLGLLLMVERSRDPLFGFALFLTLAIGLGLPYIALALAAGSIRRLPRSGEWLSWVEQLFGFVLIGLALYFLDPVVPGHLISRILPWYAAAAGIFLGFITRAGRRWRPFFAFRIVLGVAALAAVAYLAVPRRAPGQLKFAPFDTATLASARTDHEPVVVDFSADWCIPCREMEHTTFRDPAVLDAAARFVKLKANLTAQNSANQAIIAHFGIQGVPTTLFINSSGNIVKRSVGYLGPAEFVADLRRIN